MTTGKRISTDVHAMFVYRSIDILNVLGHPDKMYGLLRNVIDHVRMMEDLQKGFFLRWIDIIMKDLVPCLTEMVNELMEIVRMNPDADIDELSRVTELDYKTDHNKSFKILVKVYHC